MIRDITHYTRPTYNVNSDITIITQLPPFAVPVTNCRFTFDIHVIVLHRVFVPIDWAASPALLTNDEEQPNVGQGKSSAITSSGRIARARDPSYKRSAYTFLNQSVPHAKKMTRPRLKTESLTVRIEPEVKEALAAVAHAESRSLANMLSVMIRDWYKNHPVASGESMPKKTNEP